MIDERLLQFVRFLGAGALNTGLTYGLYLAAALVVPPGVAYTIAYVTGIAISYVLNALFVFRARMRLHSMVRYPFVYLFQYLVGLGVLQALIRLAGFPHQLGTLGAIAVSAPLTFILLRAVMLRGGAQADS